MPTTFSNRIKREIEKIKQNDHPIIMSNVAICTFNFDEKSFTILNDPDDFVNLYKYWIKHHVQKQLSPQNPDWVNNNFGQQMFGSPISDSKSNLKIHLKMTHIQLLKQNIAFIRSISSNLKEDFNHFDLHLHFGENDNNDFEYYYKVRLQILIDLYIQLLADPTRFDSNDISIICKQYPQSETALLKMLVEEQSRPSTVAAAANNYQQNKIKGSAGSSKLMDLANIVEAIQQSEKKELFDDYAQLLYHNQYHAMQAFAHDTKDYRDALVNLQEKNQRSRKRRKLEEPEEEFHEQAMQVD